MISPYLLLLLAGLQSFTMAQNAIGSDECCFDFARFTIPITFIKQYEETRIDCAYRGVIFSFFNGRRVCANPGVVWVQRAMKKLDRRLFENSTQPVPKA